MVAVPNKIRDLLAAQNIDYNKILAILVGIAGKSKGN